MNDAKSIRELIEMGIKGEFCKLGYQRGYEWTVMEILALLHTLDEAKFDIGTARVNIIDRDSDVCKECLPLEFMEDYSLNQTNRLWALVDFQQRLTTLLMFYNNHPKVKFIKYSIPDKKFLLSKSNKDTHIPVTALFNLMKKLEWTKDKDLETVKIVEELFDRMTQTTINLEIHQNLSIEEQAKWFLILNGTGKKVTKNANKSCECYVEFGKAFSDISKEIEEILIATGIDTEKILPEEKYKIPVLMSLLLPFTNSKTRTQSIPIGGFIQKMNVKNLKNVYTEAKFIISKACMFLNKNIEIENYMQIQTFVYFLSKVNYECFEEKIVQDDKLFEVIKESLMGFDLHSMSTQRKNAIVDATEKMIHIYRG
ncbi:MAG: DUF262 domain-containing protein [Synergistaceae bacterium]